MSAFHQTPASRRGTGSPNQRLAAAAGIELELNPAVERIDARSRIDDVVVAHGCHENLLAATPQDDESIADELGTVQTQHVRPLPVTGPRRVTDDGNPRSRSHLARDVEQDLVEPLDRHHGIRGGSAIGGMAAFLIGAVANENSTQTRGIFRATRKRSYAVLSGIPSISAISFTEKSSKYRTNTVLHRMRRDQAW